VHQRLPNNTKQEKPNYVLVKRGAEVVMNMLVDALVLL